MSQNEFEENDTTDIHDSKSSQASSKTTIDQLRLITERTPVIIWLGDDQGNSEFMSNHWTKYTGVDWHTAIASLSEIIHPADFDRCIELWRAALAQKVSAESEVRIKRAADGKYAWNMARVEPLKIDQELTGWIGTVTDIDGQKSAESLLQLVIDTIPGVTWWKDRDSKFLGSSKNNALRAGLKETQDIIGKTDHDLIWKEQADFFVECDRRVMESNTPEYHIIERILLADGRKAWLDTSKVPLHDADGNCVGTVGNYVDITELVKLTEQREDFMASLAHDLKIPIVGALRALDGLAGGAVGDLTNEQTDVLKKLVKSHQQLLLLIQNLLQVLKYEASPDELFMTDVDLNDLAMTCLDDLDLLAKEKNIHFERLLQPGLLALVDHTAIHRLLTNLVGNALKFTPEGGQIRVVLKEEDANVVIEVSDTGPGINEEDQTMLFQRFWQGGAMKAYASETGIGLYLCRQIAEGHGGKIRVESTEGEGATFIVAFPKSGPKKRVELRLEL